MLVTVVSLALLIQSKVDLIILIKVGLSVFKASFFLIQYIFQPLSFFCKIIF